MRHVLALLATLLWAGPLFAQPAGNDRATLAMRASEAVAVMQQVRPANEVFNARFLAEVPPERLAGLIAQLVEQHGRLLRAENVVRSGPGTALMTLRFERATATGSMVVEPAAPRRISGFRITAVTPTGVVAIRSLTADFAALPGLAGFSVTRLDASGPVAIQSLRGDQPFAVGSAFKLWVLDAVAEEVAQGRLAWDQNVPIGPRSLPSGITQDWPPGTSATVERLASLMISISDNTATDTLIRLVGRERVEARVAATGHSRPDLLRPFLMTSEVFNLKLGPKSARDAYAGADSTGRAQILTTLPQGVDPSIEANVAAFATGLPIAIDSIEWFASANDITRVLDHLRRRGDARVMAILSANQAMAPPLRAGFAFVGYKGGSEPGVLNLSWLLRRPSGKWFVVTASWVNKDAPLDNARLELLAQRLMALAQ